MWEIWANLLLPKALKSCQKFKILPNRVTLIIIKSMQFRSDNPVVNITKHFIWRKSRFPKNFSNCKQVSSDAWDFTEMQKQMLHVVPKSLFTIASSVDSSTPTSLLLLVQIPSMPSMLFSLIVKFVLYLCLHCEKNKNK